MQVQTSTSSRLQLIQEETDRQYDDLVTLRRDIHAHPEVGHEEYRTTQLVVDTLGRAGLHAEVLRVGTGAVCDILPDGVGSPDDLVGLRADLDALPIQDGKNVPYRSVTDGVPTPAATTCTRPWCSASVWSSPGCGRRVSCTAASG